MRMERSRILVVEDCPNAREGMQLVLNREYDVDTVPSAEKAMLALSERDYDLIILDVGLPGIDGYKFCAGLSVQEKFANIPVIILTGRSDIEDKLIGFSVGAKDFLSKPVDFRELKARILVHVQKRRAEAKNRTQIQVGPFRADSIRQTASYVFEGKNVDINLSPLEFKLLYFFLTHIDQAMSREQLLDNVWGHSRNVADRSVDALTSKLRQKIGPFSQLIQAAPGIGYKFLRLQENLNDALSSQNAIKKIA